MDVFFSSCSKNIASFHKSSQKVIFFENQDIPNLTKEEFKEIIREKESEIVNLKEVPKEVKSEVKSIENVVDSKLIRKQNYKLAKKKNSEIFNIKKIEQQTNSKLTFAQKVAIKKLESKANKSTEAGKTNTLSLLSLIFGGAGLLFMFTGVGGILIGIAGFIMGIISLIKGAPNRTMAILGIFGGTAMLLSLLSLGFLVPFWYPL